MKYTIKEYENVEYEYLNNMDKYTQKKCARASDTLLRKGSKNRTSNRKQRQEPSKKLE